MPVKRYGIDATASRQITLSHNTIKMIQSLPNCCFCCFVKWRQSGAAVDFPPIRPLAECPESGNNPPPICRLAFRGRERQLSLPSNAYSVPIADIPRFNRPKAGSNLKLTLQMISRRQKRGQKVAGQMRMKRDDLGSHRGDATSRPHIIHLDNMPSRFVFERLTAVFPFLEADNGWSPLRE